MKIIRRWRNRDLPPNIKSLLELGKLPEQYRRTIAEENFIMYDSRDAGTHEYGRILVFAPRKNLGILAICDVWFLDGTFKVCPGLFAKILVWFLCMHI